MNHQLAGTVVYSDDPEYDQMWLTTLFAVSSCGGPAFTVHNADDLLVSLVGPYIGGRVQGLPQMEAMKRDARRQVPGRHRAAWDVQYLIMLYTIAKRRARGGS